MTDTTIESLKNDREISEAIDRLAESVNQAISILAQATLQINRHGELTPDMRNALKALVETEAK